MIPVTPKREPADFDQNVRARGLAELQRRGLDPVQPLPPESEIEPFWRRGNNYPGCLDELYLAYDETCAYLAVRMARTAYRGSPRLSASVDHFVPYSTQAGLAYEWSNYRLASEAMNSRKGDHQDVIDPFEVETGWFHLEPVTGRVFAAPDQAEEIKARVDMTIRRLKLDDKSCRYLRSSYYTQYLFNKNQDGEYALSYLREKAPFVWQEVHRQGML